MESDLFTSKPKEHHEPRSHFSRPVNPAGHHLSAKHNPAYFLQGPRQTHRGSTTADFSRITICARATCVPDRSTTPSPRSSSSFFSASLKLTNSSSNRVFGISTLNGRSRNCVSRLALRKSIRQLLSLMMIRIGGLRQPPSAFREARRTGADCPCSFSRLIRGRCARALASDIDHNGRIRPRCGAAAAAGPAAWNVL